MADDCSLRSGFIKGVGALLAALVLFVSEQYIQHRYWPDKPQQETNVPQPPVAPAIIPIDGRVVDTLGTKTIANALVDLSVNGMHQQQNTDSEGRYAFSLQGFDRNLAASMSVKAPGYKDESVNLLLSAMAENKELRLEALAPPPGTGTGAVVGSKWVGPVTLSELKPVGSVKYMKRMDARVLSAKN